MQEGLHTHLARKIINVVYYGFIANSTVNYSKVILIIQVSECYKLTFTQMSQLQFQSISFS